MRFRICLTPALYLPLYNLLDVGISDTVKFGHFLEKKRPVYRLTNARFCGIIYI